MSTPSEKLALVENGLQIAEFIQANRTIPTKTYGRSAISKPSTRDRTRAWEAFSDSENPDTRGHEGGDQSQTRDPETKSSVSSKNHGRISRTVSFAEDTTTDGKPTRVDSGRNVKSSAESAEDREDVCFADSTYTNGGGDTKQAGDEKSKKGSKDNSGVDDRDGSEDRGGSIDIDDPTSPTMQISKSIKETTLEDLQEMDDEIERPQYKDLQKKDVLDEIKEMIPPPDPVVKKTTGENTPLSPSAERLMLRAGATQGVPQSHHNQKGSDVDVESAPNTVNSAREIEDNFDPDGEEIFDRLDSVESKVDIIMENQGKILAKLNSVLEMKEEINNIKKTLTNQSLALSTIEGYISELMIAIPKSGIPEDDADSDQPINPDLKLVIGRDNSRGRKEVTKSYSDKDKIDIADDIYFPQEIDEKYITKPINNNENNAANFVPTEDMTSVRIIKSIIRKECKNDALIEQLYDLIDEHFGKTPISEIYDTVSELLYVDKLMEPV